jgi:cohesin loading factor subunit SCC2
MTDTAFPFTDALGSHNADLPTILTEPLQHGALMQLVSKTLNAFSSTLVRVHDLIQAEEMSEQIVIVAVYVAVGPFFVEGGRASSDGKGKAKAWLTLASLKSLRMASLNLLRTLFAKYPKQRHWIVEEVLSMLSRVPDLKQKHFKLRNGRSIHSVSALLLHLIQSAAHGIRGSLAAGLQKLSQPSATQDQAEDLQMDQPDVAEAKCLLCQKQVNAAIESAAQTANAVASFLFSKSFSAKASENNYKQLLETLIADTLAVFDLAEWPAAGFLLNVCLRKMASRRTFARERV